MASKQRDKQSGTVGPELVEGPDLTVAGPSTGSGPTGSEADAGEPVVMLRVCLRPDCGRETYTDPQTHLVVTGEPQDVEARLVGKACRREVDVLIEPVRQAQDRKV